jgi:hypothetical protein
MQNRYVGDVGDFGKYGLLRWLLVDDHGTLQLRLAVLWYLVQDETHNNDGGHTSYLSKSSTALSRCDPVLFSQLQQVVARERAVSAVERSDILPSGTRFHSSRLVYERADTMAVRKLKRQEWFRQAGKCAAGADLVFLDPDNGLQCNSVTRYSRTGVKYAYYSDITSLGTPTTSLLLYHHLSRQGTAAEQIVRHADALATSVPNDYRIAALRFRRGSARVFFVATAPRHQDHVAGRLGAFMRSPWSDHFVRNELVTLRDRRLTLP